jgi:hypothetical protein
MPSSRLDPPVAQRKSSALRTRVLRRFDSCREVHGGVIGPATEPVLKTVRAFEGVGIDTSPTPPIRKVNRSGDRHRLESDRVVRHCGSRPRPSSTTAPTLPSPASGGGRGGGAWMLNQSGLWRTFEAGRHSTVWRSTRQASAIILLTAEVPAASEGVQSLRAIYAGRSVRNPRDLIRRDGTGSRACPTSGTE